MGRVVKRAFRYRFYPTVSQAAELSRTFGCVRLVYNRALAERTKLCSACWAITEHLPLDVREWTCTCGAVHDRDINAAITIRAAGLAVLACGDGVRPQRESSRAGSRR